MLRTLAWFAAVSAIAGAAVSAPAVPNAPVTERPPAGFSGGFGEPSCVHCHIGNEVNAFGGRVGVVGLPDTYEPGREYQLIVRLEAEETTLAGFQLTARFADPGGGNSGELHVLDARSALLDSAGVRYLHQTREGSATADPDGATWQFAWTAPESARPVRFNVAANSGNGDNSPLGDLVYVTESTVGPKSGTEPAPR